MHVSAVGNSVTEESTKRSQRTSPRCREFTTNIFEIACVHKECLQDGVRSQRASSKWRASYSMLVFPKKGNRHNVQ